jgi:toxin ParE1/3/4
MTVKLIKRPQAYRDMVELGDFIARDSLTAAIRFAEAFDSTCEFLQTSPDVGSIWETDNETYHDLRHWPIQGFPSHWIFYRSRQGRIEILRVLHASRDLDNLL